MIPAFLVAEPRFTPNEQAQRLSEARADVTRVLIAIGAVLAAAFAYWRMRIADATALVQTRAAEDQAMNGRYTSAVEQLASEALAVRVGGIYALERIALDAEARRESARSRDQALPPDDRATIDRLLAAQVRSYVPSPVSDAPEPDVPEDVQVALTVLGSLPTRADRQVDLSGSSLKGVRLHEADLRDADLSDADLTSASLVGANLAGAALTRADLSGADLTGANLDGAKVREVIYDHATVWPNGFGPRRA